MLLVNVNGEIKGCRCRTCLSISIYASGMHGSSEAFTLKMNSMSSFESLVHSSGSMDVQVKAFSLNATRIEPPHRLRQVSRDVASQVRFSQG